MLKYPMNRLGCLALVLTSGLLANRAVAVAEETFQLKDVQGQYLDVAKEGTPVLRYVYARDTSDAQQDFDTAKVFLHVFAPDGETTLTQGIGGKLFPHHRGIFVGWSRLSHDGKKHNLWGAKQMAQVHSKFVKTVAGSDGATVTSVIQWSGAGGVKVLRETRTHRLMADAEAHVLLDLETVLEAAYGDVKLDGDPEHAGIQFRPNTRVAENKSAQYVFPSEDDDPRKAFDLHWVAETFRLNDSLWTVQIMNHPQNPRGTRWSAYRDYGRFGPFPVIELPDGEQRVLKLRFRITAGAAPDRQQLQAQFERYVAR